MKKIIFLVLFFFTSSPLFGATDKTIFLSSASTTGFKIIHNSTNGFKANSTIASARFSEVSTRQGLFTELKINGYTKNFGLPGKPHLPVLTKLIELPQGASVRISISSYDEETIDVNKLGFPHKLVPAQPSVSKSRSRDKVEYHYDSLSYGDNHFSGEELIQFKAIGTMRGVRIGKLTLSPFQYNPVKNMLKVFNNIDFEISFEKPDTALTAQLKKKYASPAFSPAYKALANYSARTSKDAIISEGWPVTYVVVASDEFLNTDSLKSFIAWKKKIGFNVIEANTTEIHTQFPLSTKPNVITNDELKDWLQDLYDDLGNTGTAQSYVLFVGDVDQIPAFRKSSIELFDHYTDLDYCDYTGDDLPDAYYGRLPADTISELANMINKTLSYEQYTMGSTSYLDTAILIAGVDDELAPVFLNAQVAYGINEYFNTDNGFSEIFAYLYNETPNWSGVVVMDSADNGASNDLFTRIDAGAGFVNYTGHCLSNGWSNGLFDPFFITTDVDDLNDSGKYGFFIGNCCESSRFEESDSFAEELLKAENKGAVGYIGGANNTYWYEDFYWAVGTSTDINVNNAFDHEYNNTGYGVYDGLWHINGENRSQWYMTSGQMIYCGNLAVTASGSDSAQYYWEIYNLMGDPSLMPYLSVPSIIEAPEIIIKTPEVAEAIDRCGTSELTITTEANAYVTLSQNGTRIDSKFSGSSGSVELTVPPLSSTENAELIITKQNRQPTAVTITVNETLSSSPVADFMAGADPDASVFKATSGIPVNFTSLSTGCPDTFQWIFQSGMPATSSAEHPAVIYNDLGLYDVQLVAGNVEGDSPPELKPAYIRVSPNVNFVADNIRFTADNNEVRFSDLSTNNPTAWNWTFEGGTPETSNDQNPVVTYNAIGNYAVSLSITINGTSYPENGPMTKVNYIHLTPYAPVADFSASETSVNGGDRVTFTDLSTNNPTQWAWSFPGGSPATSEAQNPIITYRSAGTHNVTLIAINDGGNNVQTKEAYITVAGSVPITKDGGGGGGCFIFTAGESD